MPFSFDRLHPNIISNILQYCVNDKQNVLFLFDQLENQKSLDLCFSSLEENILAIRRAQIWKVGVCLSSENAKRCLKSGKPRSLNCDQEVMLVFQNQTSVEYDLYWVGYNGGLRHNGKIHSKNSLQVSSFLTHPFLIRRHDILHGMYIPINPCKSHVVTIRDNEKIQVVKGTKNGQKIKMRKKYIPFDLLGFQIIIEEKVLKKYSSLKSCLHQDIRQFLNVCPKPVIGILKRIPIYVNEEMWFGSEDCPTRGRGMCYHPEVRVLVARGQDPIKAKSIEIYRVEDYLEWRTFQPWMIFHEYSHAFHHHIGAHRKDVKQCYQHAISSGLYQSVPYILGGQTKHYGASNMHEYFAENSEAFFGKNDYYPFNRKQLKEYDPRCFNLLSKLWSLSAEEIHAEHLKHRKNGTHQEVHFDETYDDILSKRR